MAGRIIAPDGAPATEPTADGAAQVAATAERIADSVGRVLAGREQAVRTAIACILSGGHLLIEDIPGVGKTLLAQALAQSVGGSFHRIQGTPDLLPGDVTGTMMPQGDGLRVHVPARADLLQHRRVRRAQPRQPAHPVGAARGDRGGCRHGRRRHPRAAVAVPADRHAEPRRDDRYLSARRGRARPLRRRGDARTGAARGRGRGAHGSPWAVDAAHGRTRWSTSPISSPRATP